MSYLQVFADVLSRIHENFVLIMFFSELPLFIFLPFFGLFILGHKYY